MRARVALIVAPILVAALAACAGLALGGADFLRQHLLPLLAAAAATTALVTVAVKGILSIMRGAVLSVRRPRALGQSGAAFAEFVIVIIPFMLMLTALMQLALASLARVLVSYAAFCAARAAIVIVPIRGNDASQSGLAAAIGNEGAGRVGAGANTRIDFQMSTKAAYIRNAAAYAMIPASPSIDIVVEDTVNNWKDYWKNRVQAGLTPWDVAVDALTELSQLPPAQRDAFKEQVKDIAKGGLDTPAKRDQAKAEFDALIKDHPKDRQDQERAAFAQYVDNYKGGDFKDPGGDPSWLQKTMESTLSGSLQKYRGAIMANVNTNQAGNFGGYRVAKALDSGFAANMDGAGGAILRALRKLIYARVATVVELEDGQGNLKSHFAWGDPITAKVTHLYYCQIPLANRFAGKPYYDLPVGTQLDMTTGPMNYVSAVGIPGYFLPLTARHTLINQGKP